MDKIDGTNHSENSTKSNLKSIYSATHIIAFFGEAAEDITLFTTKVCSMDSRVLVVDLSHNKKLFCSVVGNIKGKAVIYRKVCYTYDVDYFNKFKSDYDYVFVFSDSMVENTKIIEQIEHVYLNIGVCKYSLMLLGKMLASIEDKLSYSIICRGTEKDAKRKLLLENLQMLCIKRNKPERIYYVPSDIKDQDSLLRFEYGVLDVSQLSNPMISLISEICEKLRKLSGKTLSYTAQKAERSMNWIM